MSAAAVGEGRVWGLPAPGFQPSGPSSLGCALDGAGAVGVSWVRRKRHSGGWERPPEGAVRTVEKEGVPGSLAPYFFPAEAQFMGRTQSAGTAGPPGRRVQPPSAGSALSQPWARGAEARRGEPQLLRPGSHWRPGRRSRPPGLGLSRLIGRSRGTECPGAKAQRLPGPQFPLLLRLSWVPPMPMPTVCHRSRGVHRGEEGLGATGPHTGAALTF